MILMKKTLNLLVLMATLSFYACGQQTSNKVEIYFQQDKDLKFILDKNLFEKADQASAKSKTTDFTVSGYHVLTGTFDELVLKAKGQLVNTFHTKESDLFVEKIDKPYFKGLIIFGTNGREASSIYLFKANKGFGWVTMTFNHDQKETEKVDLIIASIKETK